MKIRVQRTDESISFKKEWFDRNDNAWFQKNIMMPKDIFRLAERIFESFPRFREIVFNTELTEQ